MFTPRRSLVMAAPLLDGFPRRLSKWACSDVLFQLEIAFRSPLRVYRSTAFHKAAYGTPSAKLLSRDHRDRHSDRCTSLMANPALERPQLPFCPCSDSRHSLAVHRKS